MSTSSSKFKLFYTPTSCGAASFLGASIAGLDFDAEEVNLGTHKLVKDDSDYYAINFKGNVPAIVTAKGSLINENVAALLFVGDQARAKGKELAPPEGTDGRYIFLSILAFIATEVQTCFAPLFAHLRGGPEVPNALPNLYKKFDVLEKHYLKGDYLYGNSLTVADLYLYIIFSWLPDVNATLDDHPKLRAFQERVASLDVVKAGYEQISKRGVELRKH